MSTVSASYQIADGERAPTRLGRYELLGKLAVGGMAEIYLARLAGEAGFEKIVVVKRLLPELVASRAFVTMFLDEGKLVSRLDHPNVCEVFELGRDGRDYFIAMPYLDGVSVAELIARPSAALRERERIAAAIVVQACAGLHHAHELGVVHRDVSPSNLFVTTAGVVKVLDFGIAKVSGATAETEAGMVKGKAAYMAPEQVLGGALDRRCDVFSLGIVLFELVTRTRLFGRDSDYLTARAILEDLIPRADEIVPGVTPALADAIARALARDPAARPRDARELARELEAAVPSLASQAQLADVLASEHVVELGAQRTRQATAIALARAHHASSAVETNPLTAARRRRRIAPWLAGAVALAAVVTIAYELGKGTSPATAASHDAAPLAQAQPQPQPEPPPADRAEPPEIEMPGDAPRPRAPTPPGQISIDSSPWATVTIDGRALGITPLLHVSLPAGKHRLHAVLGDGRSRDITVAIEAGRVAPPLVLHW